MRRVLCPDPKIQTREAPPLRRRFLIGQLRPGVEAVDVALATQRADAACSVVGRRAVLCDARRSASPARRGGR